MPKAEIRDGKLTLPLSDELREKLDVHDGDEFEAHVFGCSVTFTRSSPNARRRAGERILAITDEVRPTPTQALKSTDQVEQEIVEYVKETRRARRTRRHD
ncbi:MAG TPA: hypothetical protein VKF83_10190 [Stellaceae bacterium]|nr:hypothetical protein [Stellaceae bacterium]